MRMTTGRLSDIAVKRPRIDWSAMNEKLKALQPGERLSIECPLGMATSRLRSTILTRAKHYEYGDWRVRTMTGGRTIHCFLAPI